jgi:hypothetical protein
MGACGNQKKEIQPNKNQVVQKTQETQDTRQYNNNRDSSPAMANKLQNRDQQFISQIREIEIKIILDTMDNVLYTGKFNTNQELIEVLSTIATKLPRNAEFFVIDKNGQDITKEKKTKIANIFGDVDRTVITMKYLGLDIAKDVRKEYQRINLIGAPKFETEPFEVVYYDKRLNKLKIHFLNDTSDIRDFGYFSSVCNGRDKIFISGGECPGNGETKALSNFVAIDLNNFEVTRLKDLCVPRYWHSSIYIPNRYIFIVGGAGEKTVEVYDIDNDTISLDSVLFEERSEPSLCLINNAFLYAFCGFKYKINYITSVERCNLQVKDRTWELVNYRPSGFSIQINFFAVAYYKDVILLLGGNSPNINNKENFIYNPVNDSIESSSFSPVNDIFQDKFFIPLGENLSALIPICPADNAKVLILRDDKLESLSLADYDPY